MAQDTEKNKQQGSNPSNQGNQSSNQWNQNKPGSQPGQSGSHPEHSSNPQDISKKNPGQHGSGEYDKSDKGQGESEPKRRVS